MGSVSHIFPIGMDDPLCSEEIDKLRDPIGELFSSHVHSATVNVPRAVK